MYVFLTINGYVANLPSGEKTGACSTMLPPARNCSSSRSSKIMVFRGDVDSNNRQCFGTVCGWEYSPNSAF